MEKIAVVNTSWNDLYASRATFSFDIAPNENNAANFEAIKEEKVGTLARERQKEADQVESPREKGPFFLTRHELEELEKLDFFCKETE